jgi:molybdate transport system substrate-binding protein
VTVAPGPRVTPARTARAIAALIATALVLVACAVAPDPNPRGAPAIGDARGLSGELTIYAAASLASSFDELATSFEAENPGVTIRPIVFDGSSTLVTQLAEGAPADVFASADETSMARAVEAGLVSADDPVLFARNTLVIAVPVGNPAGVRSLDDLARSDLTLVLCAIEVPCGAASQMLLARHGIETAPASFEQSVTAVLTKVAAGEADAGLVYVTDVHGRDDVEGIVPDGAQNVANRYPITALRASVNPDAAAAFVAFVTGERGRAILTEHGFGSP